MNFKNFISTKPCHRQRHAFALVLVLVLLSLMAIIAVGYLSSMSSERATANAFANKTRAEQVAQAGADTAIGLLRDCFKDFPDSVTVWDPTPNILPPPSPTPTPTPIPSSPPISPAETTTLYFRAVPQASNSNLPDPAPGIADPNFNNADFTGGNSPNNVDANGVDKRQIFVLPLVSGATIQPLLNKASTLPPLTTTNSVDLNARRQINDPGWIGYPPNYINPSNPPNIKLPKPFVVPWVEIKQSDGVSDPTKAPVIGRYAYWVEDESFRANISYAGLGKNVNYPANGSGSKSYSHQRLDNVVNFPPTNILLTPTAVDLLGPLDAIANSYPLSSADPYSQLAQNIFDARASYPGQLFPEAHAFTHAPGLTTALPSPSPSNATIADALRFLTTSQSSALNLTRHGTQRLNLNDVVDPTISPDSTTHTTTIQKQVEKIVKTLQFHAPNFGQRLYRIAPGTTGQKVSSGSVVDPDVLNQMTVGTDFSSFSPYVVNYPKIYYYKIAANIHDYMSNWAFPTRIQDPGQVTGPGAPTIPPNLDGDNTNWAFGKSAAPFMQECAVRYQRLDGGSGTPFVMAIDYYIEFWNMSTRTVRATDLGPNPFIKIGNTTRWQVNNSEAFPKKNPTVGAWSTADDLISDDADSVSPSDTRPTSTKRDYKIDLTGVSFPPGQITVITTDKAYKEVITDTEALNHVIVCPWVKNFGKSVYKGHFPAGRVTASSDVLDMAFENPPLYPNGTTNGSDFETDITVGSDWGVIDGLQGALPLSFSGGHISVPYTGKSGNYPNVFGGVLRGNWTNTSNRLNQGLETSSVGDPRTNNEQLSYTLNPFDTDINPSIDRTRFNTFEIVSGGNTTSPAPGSPDNGVIPTLGQPNYRSVRPNRTENPWPDLPPYYSSPDDNPTAVDLILTADKAPMPVANITAPASGAPTLTSIGQLGDVYDPSRMIDYCTVGGSRGGGRSLKIGQHDDRWDGSENSASRTWTAWRLADIFSTTNAMQLPGLININGVIRDNGEALRAALTGFRFQLDPASSPLGDPTLADSPDPSKPSRLQIDQLVTEVKNRLSQASVKSTGASNVGVSQTGVGPFWERGELSELVGFGRTPDPYKQDSYPYKKTTYYSQSDLTGIDMSLRVFDRGREELFRRLVEMTTTRGNVFTVYVVGQAISPTSPTDPTKRVVSTHQLKVTFCLVPKTAPDPNGITKDFHPATLPNNQPADFDPAKDMEARFAKPHHYEAQILSVSSGNS